MLRAGDQDVTVNLPEQRPDRLCRRTVSQRNATALDVKSSMNPTESLDCGLCQGADGPRALAGAIGVTGWGALRRPARWMERSGVCCRSRTSQTAATVARQRRHGGAARPTGDRTDRPDRRGRDGIRVNGRSCADPPVCRLRAGTQTEHRISALASGASSASIEGTACPRTVPAPTCSRCGRDVTLDRLGTRS